MGLFKDLNFKNRNGVLVSPDSEKLGGYTLSEVKSQIKPTFVNIGGGTLSKATITSANLPTTLHKDSSWTQYKPVAYNFTDLGADTINTNDIFSDGSCIATYTFNGNANDLSGNYNGVETSITYSTGLIGQCATFNGTKSYISNLPSFNMLSNFSISLWVKFNSIPTSAQMLLGHMFAASQTTSGVAERFYLQILSNGTLETSFANSATYTSLNSTVQICNGIWHNIVINYSAGVVNTYIDSILDGTYTFTVPSNVKLKIPQFGRRYRTDTTPDLYLTGYLDQVRIFNRILTTDEIISLYKEPSAKPRKLLINNVEQSIISETLPVDTTNTHDIFGDGSCKATYQFNGNANDLGNTYNGTATSVTYGAGKFGQSAVFNGTSSGVHCLLPSELKQYNMKITISAWVNVGTLTQNKAILTIGNSVKFISGLSMGQSSIAFGMNVDSGAVSSKSVAAPISITNTGWRLLTGVYDGTTSYIYLDGILQAKNSVVNNANGGNGIDGLNIGFQSSNYPTSYFVGSIDQVRIFNRVLTDYEIGILYKETKPAITTFGTVLTNEKDLQIKVEGNADIVELNFVEGV